MRAEKFKEEKQKRRDAIALMLSRDLCLSTILSSLSLSLLIPSFYRRYNNNNNNNLSLSATITAL